MAQFASIRVVDVAVGVTVGVVDGAVDEVVVVSVVEVDSLVDIEVTVRRAS